MSKKAKIKKLKKKLKAFEKIIKPDSLTLTSSENPNEQVTLSFVGGVVTFIKAVKVVSEETSTAEISEVTFN